MEKSDYFNHNKALKTKLICFIISAILLASFIIPFVNAETYIFVTKWGTEGAGPGEFLYPAGVAVDGSGNVYVADFLNDRVQKFTSTGTYLTQWGSSGYSDGHFDHLYGVAVDGSGNVYVTDYYNDRVQKFTSTGTYLLQWGETGASDGQLSGPFGVAVDGSGNVYVADFYNDRVQKFTSTGTYLTQWGTYGIADGQFDDPYGVAVDGSGNVYVTDYYNHRVQKFALEPSIYSVDFVSVEDSAATNNLGSIHRHEGIIIVFGLPWFDQSMLSGDYEIEYVPQSGYVFDHWETEGGVSVDSATAQTATVTVSDDGLLRAVYKEATRDALWDRLVEIILAWPTSTAEQRAELWEEIVEIILLWPTAS
jgi:hypothetical protein